MTAGGSLSDGSPACVGHEEGFTNFSLFTPVSSPKAEEDLLLPRVPTPHNLSLEASEEHGAHWLQVACWAAHVSFVLSRFLFL